MSYEQWGRASYSGALEAAGADVLAFKKFGSYQGDWLAKVEIGNRTGWVHDYYGSCSGCDALEAEFGYGFFSAGQYEYRSGDGERVWVPHDEDTIRTRKQIFAQFGQRYLEDLYTPEELIEKLERNDWGDHGEMIGFVKSNEPNLEFARK